MNRKRERRDNYITYLTSYLIVLVVPMLITIIGYIYSNKMIGQEVLNYQTAILSRTQGIGDQIVSNHIMIKGSMLSNTHLGNLMNADQWCGTLMFDIKALKTDLNSIANSNNIIADAQIYFPKSGDLVTTRRRYPPQLTYIYTDGAGIAGGYDSIINKKKVSGYYILNEGTADCSIYFYQNIFGRNYRDIQASIVTVLRWEDIRHLLGSLGEYSEETIFLINQDNQILGDSNPETNISTLSYDFFTEEGKLFQTKLGNEDYICSFVHSDVMDVKYVMCIPRKIYYRKNSLLLLVIFIELALCIFLGSSLAIYFARRTYSPIERVLNKLNAVRKGKDGETFQIFDNLEAALSTMLSDYDTMEKELHDRNELLHDKMLVSILSGRRQDDTLILEYKANLQKKMEEEWGTDRFYVVLIGFHNLEGSILSTRVQENDDNISLAFFSIKNVLGECLFHGNWGLIAETDNVVAFIVKSEDTLTEKLQSCVTFFKDVFHLEIYGAVSMLHQGVEEFPVAYEEAMNTVNFKSFWADDVEDIIFYETSQVHGKSRAAGKYADQIKKIGNCIASRDYKSVKIIMGQILDECFYKDIRYMQLNQCQAQGIISLVLSMFDAADDEESAEFYARLQIPERLLQTRSLNQLRQEINHIFDEIIQEYDRKAMHEVPQWVLATQKYIENNYADPNLSITAIAERFNLSLSYIGRMYKKYTGDGILEYLHLIRVEKCKELLLQGESVKDVAVKSGFLDSKAMIRTFRKYEGITPGQYKKQRLPEE